ncbi:MAG: hypothetical protein QE570_01060 [Verrucomicrobiota bacterium]|jgi:hypothetical protein|nr:hypothetical protein [Verrucomicrobiota bacterium]
MPEFTIQLPETLVPLLNRKAKEKNESPESYLASFFAVSLEDEQEADPARQQLEDILEERDKGPFITITDMKALKEEVMTKVRERLQQKSSHA